MLKRPRTGKRRSFFPRDGRENMHAKQGLEAVFKSASA
ncbi:hypothetical protein MBELCI_2719 [Limimaricola cinnabarinus LL-001]|uniref:Uncharacterized protein n=1 Tax=Limimaricola cinnabarinus LL-001 TaxID=1337093 RepID=U2Z6G7_9RHOB|nr:hypothetical protein MBELCI_2719 [Limimaricola cinnabarinus LL-001]